MRSRPVRTMAPSAAPGRKTRSHRPLAGYRPQYYDVCRNGSTGPGLRQESLVRHGPSNPARDALGRAVRKGSPLASRRRSALSSLTESAGPFISMSSDVVLGTNVKLGKFINLYGC